MFLAEAHWEETCQALRKAASLENVPLSSEAVCPVRIVINLVARENKADTYPEHCNERKSSLKKNARSWVLHCANPAEACKILFPDTSLPKAVAGCYGHLQIPPRRMI